MRNDSDTQKLLNDNTLQTLVIASSYLYNNIKDIHQLQFHRLNPNNTRLIVSGNMHQTNYNVVAIRFGTTARLIVCHDNYPYKKLMTRLNITNYTVITNLCTSKPAKECAFCIVNGIAHYDVQHLSLIETYALTEEDIIGTVYEDSNLIIESEGDTWRYRFSLKSESMAFVFKTNNTSSLDYISNILQMPAQYDSYTLHHKLTTEV